MHGAGNDGRARVLNRRQASGEASAFGRRRTWSHCLARHHDDEAVVVEGLLLEVVRLKFRPLQGTDLAAEIVSCDTAIGTLRVADGSISNFNGVVYVQVSDLPAACKKARELGGTVPPVFPFNLPNSTGAIALLSDPAGHPIGMYSNTLLPSAALLGR